MFKKWTPKTLFAVLLATAIISCNKPEAPGSSQDRAPTSNEVYVLVFAIKPPDLNPIVLKNCESWPMVKGAEIIKFSVKGFIDSGMKCEQSPGAISFSCMGNGVVIKAVLQKDKQECLDFPQQTAETLKKLMK